MKTKEEIIIGDEVVNIRKGKKGEPSIIIEFVHVIKKGEEE